MKVIIRISAEKDIREIFNWYEDIQEDLGVQFLDDFENTLIYIAAFPASFRVKYKTLRIVSMGRFPYFIFFRISKEGIIIQKVSHAHRNKRRLKL